MPMYCSFRGQIIFLLFSTQKQYFHVNKNTYHGRKAILLRIKTEIYLTKLLTLGAIYKWRNTKLGNFWSKYFPPSDGVKKLDTLFLCDATILLSLLKGNENGQSDNTELRAI